MTVADRDYRAPRHARARRRSADDESIRNAAERFLESKDEEVDSMLDELLSEEEEGAGS